MNGGGNLLLVSSSHATAFDGVTTVADPLSLQGMKCSAQASRTTKAKHAAAAKCRKYAEVADSQQADFIPFSIESTGGIGKEAADLIDQLCTASRDFLSLPSHHPFAHDVFSSVAIAIQRGNAFALIAGDRHAVMEARKRESLQT